MNIILKQQQCSPMKSVIIRKASCLSPVNMARQSEISVAKFESLVNKLYQVKHLTATEADEAKIQCDDFLKSVVCQNLPSFEEFNFLIFNLTSFSAHICTETISTKIYGRCAFLFS